MNRTPMNRGTGFKRPAYHRPPPSAPTKVLRGVVETIGHAPANPKENVITSLAYQALVRMLPCAHCGIEGFTQFCHSDEGKGLGIKTDDRRGWPGCGPRTGTPGCHWLIGTSGRFTRQQRRELEAAYSADARAEIIAAGNWPKKLPFYVPKEPLAQ